MRPDIKFEWPRIEAAGQSRPNDLQLGSTRVSRVSMGVPPIDLRSRIIFFTQKSPQSEPTVANQRSSGDPEVIQSELDVSSSEPDAILSELWLTSTDPNRSPVLQKLHSNVTVNA